MELRALIDKLTKPFPMFLYKKIGFFAVALLIVLNLLFFLPRLMPSSPVDLLVSTITGPGTGVTSLGGQQMSGTPATEKIEVLMRIYKGEFALGKPMYVKYISFWKRFLTLDFGKSFFQYPISVSTLIGNSLPWTLALVIPVLPVGFVVGNWIGSRAAYYGGRLEDLLYYFSMILSQAPYYWFGLILILVFGTKLGWFPVFGAYSGSYMGPTFSFPWFLDALHHWILPFLSLVGLGIGGWSVGMRAMAVYEMESDYMQFSKQLGFTEEKLRTMAKDNSILPNFTQLPLMLSSLIGNTLLVEVIFGYPGLGTLLYNAAFRQDYPVLEATFGITILITLLGNFLCDIIYGKIDPRIGTSYVEGE